MKLFIYYYINYNNYNLFFNFFPLSERRSYLGELYIDD